MGPIVAVAQPPLAVIVTDCDNVEKMVTEVDRDWERVTVTVLEMDPVGGGVKVLVTLEQPLVETEKEGPAVPETQVVAEPPVGEALSHEDGVAHGEGEGEEVTSGFVCDERAEGEEDAVSPPPPDPVIEAEAQKEPVEQGDKDVEREGLPVPVLDGALLTLRVDVKMPVGAVVEDPPNPEEEEADAEAEKGAEGDLVTLPLPVDVLHLVGEGVADRHMLEEGVCVKESVGVAVTAITD